MIPPFNLGENERYQVTQQVAEGGTAKIYVAWDQVDRVWRAIKMLRPEARARTDTRKRLKSEYDTLTRLSHPNILRVFDAAIWGQEAWIAMEYAERGSVGHFLEDHGKMPWGAALEVCRQVCLALEHAHAEGVIHRDIKPHNVLVNGRGTCVLADFGIAALDDELITRITTTGTALGTLGYMAPEQLDSAKEVDGRADVYSIAATLYHLLLGREPQDLFFTAPKDPEVLALPARIQLLILDGGRRNPDHRIPGVKQMRRWIEEAMSDHPLKAGFPLLAGPVPPPLPTGFGSTVRPSGPATWEGKRADLNKVAETMNLSPERVARPAPEPDDADTTWDITSDRSTDDRAGGSRPGDKA